MEIQKPDQQTEASHQEAQVEAQSQPVADDDDFLKGVAPACNLGEGCESCQ